MAMLDNHEGEQVSRASILLALAGMGLYAMTGQIILVRELLVIFYGSELSLGLIFACWLIWVSAGAAVASRAIPRLQDPRRWLSRALLIALICLPVQTVLIRALRGILGTPPGLLIPLAEITLATALALMPLSFFVGFTFPLASALHAGRSSRPARSIGTIYVAETAGSVVGAALFTYAFAGRMNHLSVEALSALPLLAACVLLHAPGSGNGSRLGRTAVTVLSVGVVGFLLAGAARWVDTETILLRWTFGHPGIELIEWKDSKYQHLSAGGLAGQTTLYGNGAPLFSLPDEYDAAIAAHLLLVQHPEPRRVLLLGGGTPEMFREILKHPVESLDFVETDPELIALTRRFSRGESASVFDDPRLHIHMMDGRSFLRISEDLYDLVITRLPDPTTAMLNRFYTVEFFRQAAGRLRPGGTFAFSVGGAVNYMGEEVGPFRSTLFHSLFKVFPHVLVTPGQRNVFIASRSADSITKDPVVLAARYADRNIASEHFSPLLYSDLVQPERTAWFRAELETFPAGILNRDARPVSYFHTVLLWDRFSESQIGPILRRLAGLRLWMPLLALVLCVVVRFAWLALHPSSQRSRPAFNALSTIATTGFLAMGVQLTILFAFQNQLGYIYEKVGLVVATFMLGLFFGGRLGSARLAKPIRPARVLGCVDAAMILLCLALPELLALPSDAGRTAIGVPTELWFFLLSGATGCLAGIQFPLAGQLYLDVNATVPRAAGLVDSADHLGAALGALLVGSLLIPLLGVMNTCFLMAGLKSANLLFLVVRE